MDETVERIDGQTPNGGDYAIALYQDADGAPIAKADALRAEVIEYGADNRPIAVSFLDLTGDDDGDDANRPDESEGDDRDGD